MPNGVCLKANLHDMIFAHDYRMWLAYTMPAAQVTLSKSNQQHPYDSHRQYVKWRRILKHVLKSYDNSSHSQFWITRVVYNFSKLAFRQELTQTSMSKHLQSMAWKCKFHTISYFHISRIIFIVTVRFSWLEIVLCKLAFRQSWLKIACLSIFMVWLRNTSFTQ